MDSVFTPRRRLGLVAVSISLMGLTTLIPSTTTAAQDSESLAVGALICDEAPDQSDAGCEAWGPVTVTASDEAGVIIGSCTLQPLDTPNGGSIASCGIDVPFNATYLVTLDESPVPAGYVVRENPITFTATDTEQGGGDGPDIYFVLYPTPDEPAPSEPVATEPAATDPAAPVPSEEDEESSAPVPGSADTGSPAAIYAGDCDIDFGDAEAVAVLSEVTEPTGEPQGADDTSAVETSFTTLDLPLDDILADDHVLVVFDEDDDNVVLACGAIGGIVIDDGALTFGLPAVGESRFSGIAYLTEDGDQTLATIFLAEELSATTPEA